MAATDILVKVGADITDFSRKMAESNKALSKFTRETKDTFGAFQKTGGALTKWVTTPALAATTALTGVTLVKGFGRLLGIDTARAKLGALGHDADGVEQIMKNALEAVKGTSYGLDEAATAAASAVAAGIKPGKELARYLGIAGDAAAIAGTDFSEMGSIFNKVQTAQRAYTGDLNMLADRGIPIYQWIADEAGTTAEAVRDMAADGEVSSKMFLDAVEKNIGGAAKEIGEKSFAAAIKNIGSDIARIGANFLDAGGDAGGFFSTVKPLLTEFRGFLEGLEGKASELGKKFGESFMKFVETMRKLKAAYDDLSPAVQDFIKKAAAFGAVFVVMIGPILQLIGLIPTFVAAFESLKVIFASVSAVASTAGVSFTSLGGVLGALTGPIGWVILAIVGIGTALVIAYNKVEWFRDMVDAAWAAIKDAFFTAISWIKDNVVVPIMTEVSAFMGEILGKIKDYWDKYGDLILSTAQLYFGAVWEYIKMVMGVIKGIFEIVWPIISGIVQVVWGVIKMTIRTAMDIISGIIDTMMALIRGDWEGAWESIKGILVNIWENMKGFLQDVDLVQIGKDIIQGLIDGISSMGSAVWDAAKGIAGKIKDGVKGFLDIHSPSRVMKGLGVFTGKGLALGIADTVGLVEKATAKLADAATPEPKQISLDYSTPSGSYASLASAISGTVDVNAREDMIAGAIGRLEAKLENLRIEMDGKEFGRAVSDVSEKSRDSAVRSGGRRRI